jgi:hypothetical protein
VLTLGRAFFGVHTRLVRLSGKCIKCALRSGDMRDGALGHACVCSELVSMRAGPFAHVLIQHITPSSYRVARPSYGCPTDDLRWKCVYRRTLRDTSTFKFVHVALTCEKSRIVMGPSRLPMNTF